MFRLNKLLLSLITIEIVYGGGGRLLDGLGVPPLRYALFFLALSLFILNFICFVAKVTYKKFILILSIILLPVYGALVGVVSDNNISSIMFDVQPFMYIMILPFLCFMDERLTNWTTKFFINTVKVYSVLVSIMYILYIALLKAGLINFNYIYSILSETSEFFFRPSGAFFAKSFFFLGIGAIFFFCERKTKLFMLTMVALILTETRGVFLFSCVAIMIANLKINSIAKNTAFILFVVTAGIAMIIIVGERGGDSDSVRINDFAYVMSNITDISTLFGKGFGAYIGDRSRIEVVPLEIFYKTGIVGIVISLIPVVVFSIKSLFGKVSTTSIQIVCALIFGVGVSITNPFIYTPMGIYVIAMAINESCRVNDKPSTT